MTASQWKWLMRSLILSGGAFMLVVLVRNALPWYAETGVCPEYGRDFWEKSIRRRMTNSSSMMLENRISPLKIADGAYYDTIHNWWIVPFEVGGTRSRALMDCTGYWERTGGD